MTYSDPDHSLSEARFITLGVSTHGNLLFVAHAERQDRIRIISARRATQREREFYEEKG